MYMQARCCSSVLSWPCLLLAEAAVADAALTSGVSLHAGRL